MANTINFILTNSAAELIPKVLNGKTLNFTRMAVGDGFSYGETVSKGFKTLVNEVLSIDITKKEILSPSSVKITSAFKNTDAQQEFYYREVGLFAQDPDTGEEVLYAYGNRNDAAELITPTGSNVVNKQLIFVITVGDSANVTFNVNADIYALQSDMLDVQANKADKNLANTGMITNCLLEVPQRIKYELSPEGALTIKAGTVLIIPYETEDLRSTYLVGSTFLHQNLKVLDIQYADSKFFVWVELLEDKTLRTIDTSADCFIVFNVEENLFSAYAISNIASGTDTSTTTGLYFNTSDNVISFAGSNHFSLPLLSVDYEASVPVSVKQVFNGMGYIGSTIWVDKGVKGLIPNGRNPDGTLNNIELDVNKLSMQNFHITNIHTFGIGADLKINVFARTYNGPTVDYVYFDEPENFIYASLNIYEGLFLGEVSGTSGPITSFKPKKPIQIMDYDDYLKKIKELESRISALEAI